MALKDVKDLFVAEPWWDGAGGSASRIVFGRDGMLYMTAGSGGGANFGQGQVTNIHKGKIMRLRDDGTVPPDNPFVGSSEFKPEIYSWGHRNSLALIVHPVSGELWNSENGPNGGDEINVDQGREELRLAGGQHGPLVRRAVAGQVREGRHGRDRWCTGCRRLRRPGSWSTPATSSRPWRNNAFVGAMRYGEIPNTGHLQRIVFNEKTEEIRREMLLTEFRQRVRDVRQGPDGFVYLLTDESPGALLKLEPAQ